MSMDGTETAGFPGEIPSFYPLCPAFSQEIWYICRLPPPLSGYPVREVIFLNPKLHQQRTTEDLRQDPESRLCPAYNGVSIKKFYLPSEEMGVRVIDNCAEENQR